MRDVGCIDWFEEAGEVDRGREESVGCQGFWHRGREGSDQGVIHRSSQGEGICRS